MMTAGIDLATAHSKTAVCVVDWSGSEVCVDFRGDTSDRGLIQICRDGTVDKVGIDCPFGWPAPFVAAISAHALGQAWPGRGNRDPDAFRSTLAFRLTDLRVKEKPLGAAPLAVAADKLGRTAMRCALLLDELGTIDRSGRTGRLAEVYPAASLRTWRLHHLKQKGSEAILEQLEKLMPTMKFQPGARSQCVRSDHALDALICAITARAVAIDRTTLPVTNEEVTRAAMEGWIHVPTVGPDELARRVTVEDPRGASGGLRV
jgi:predicted nuclease with RNAse H fold